MAGKNPSRLRLEWNGYRSWCSADPEFSRRILLLVPYRWGRHFAVTGASAMSLYLPLSGVNPAAYFFTPLCVFPLFSAMMQNSGGRNSLHLF